MSELDQIKSRLNAATPGPWGSVEDTYRAVPMHRIGSSVVGSDVAQVIMHASHDKADAEFIAATPVDVARLISAVEAVLAQADTLDALGNKAIANRIRAAVENALNL